MRKLMLSAVCLQCLILRAVTAEEQSAAKPQPGALADYVAKEDPSYGWTERRSGKLGAGDYVELTLTSQTWRGIVWKHQLFIYKPSKLSSDGQAMLLIEGGRWREELAAAPGVDERLPGTAYVIAAAAEQMQAPVAVLLQVPQQPIFGGMIEDQIISYTFAQFLKTGQSDWPLLLPMVKSAVRGMDAIQECTSKTWSLDIKNFLVSGASKRGWTTWLTAAVDKRVNALAPMVIDMLNMGPQMKHQVASFGDFSTEINDYTQKRLQEQLDTPAGLVLQSIIDPYSYRHLLKQPKLILLGTNDRYWPVDALNLYWNELEGEKYILYVPNNGHGLRDLVRVVGTISALHRSCCDGKPLPKLEWKFDEQEKELVLEVRSNTQPQEVQVWIAQSKTKDFRDSTWTARDVQAVDGVYRHRITLPAQGHVAAFGEAVFEGQGVPFYLSTNMRVAAGTDSARPVSK